MSDTPHLALPRLAAAQAQKHVTHNEALDRLDALVQLAVKARGRNAPPADPADGERWLVGAGSGAFAGHDGAVALYEAGAWRFLTPRPGWRLYVETEDRMLLFDGAAWRPLVALERVERLGIATDADAYNTLAAKINAALFTAREAGEGGSGDLRVVLNKAAPGNVLAQLYQTAYGGRAETGLVGDDDYRIRVSADGGTWRDALAVDRMTGLVRFPAGPPAVGHPWRNRLLNPGFSVNQRAFAGGALAAGAFGPDRWRAGPGGATLALAGETATLTGALVQTIESPGLAGQAVTVSVEDPDAALTVTVGAGGDGASGTIEAGPGRRGVTLVVPAAAAGHLECRIVAAAGAASFRRPQLEPGGAATPFEGRAPALEHLLCRRFYLALTAGGAAAALPVAAYRSASAFEAVLPLAVPLRAAPIVRHSSPAFSAASPTGNAVAVYDVAAGGWHGGSGAPAFTLAGPPTALGAVLRLTLASASGTQGGQAQLWCGPDAAIALDAEL